VVRAIVTSTGRVRRQGGLILGGDSAHSVAPYAAEAYVRIFLSSVISGMETYRAAAQRAAETLGHTVTMAEDFGASPFSPQQVCLGAVRDADIVMLLLGARYGTPQESGLSPTHEEYREARASKPVLVFLQENVSREPAQQACLDEVSTWERGGYRESFDTPDSLSAAVIRALHRWELNQQAGPVDEQDLEARAAAMLPRPPSHAPGVPLLHVVVAGGPTQQILRPTALDDQRLHRDIQREAVYGDRPVFDSQHGVPAPIVNLSTLVVAQPPAEITLDEYGSVRVSRPARDPGGRSPMASGISCLTEEDVRERVADCLRYAGWLLNRADPTNKLSRVAVACRLTGAGYLPWRTRSEVAASPNAAQMNLSNSEFAASPTVVLPRPALLYDGEKLADDIAAQLRRQLK